MSFINTIQIIGTGNRTYKCLKNNMDQLLSNRGESYTIEEIMDIDEILNFKLDYIPALAINGNVIMQRENYAPSIEELEEVLNKYLQKSNNMNTILVPTDFSPNAKGAFEFAKRLAEKLNANIKVVHIHNPASDGIIPTDIGGATIMEQAKEEMLDKFIHVDDTSIMENVITELMIDKEMVIGFAAEEIVRMSKNGEIDMIVMGTKGRGGALEKLFGSVSTHVSQKASCPVWLVPEGTPYKNLEKIVYASNYEMADENLMEEVFKLSDHFDAEVHFLHVEEAKGDNEMDELILGKLFEKKLPDHNFKLTSIASDSVWSGICKYARDEKADLVTLITKHRGFINSLLHKSVTKQVILHANCPILVLHV